jgi:K+-sensing histidine kinase KdpD
VEADSERIQRVIVNFVNNAVKYATNSKTIIIRVEQEPAQVKVAVTDINHLIGRKQGDALTKGRFEHTRRRHFTVI